MQALTSFLHTLSYRWRLRWLGLFLAGLFATVGLSLQPVGAQVNEVEGSFCAVSTDPIDTPQQGRSYGDPHINTYDTLHYSFQTLGEYILSESEDGSFQVQARQGRVANRDNLSLNTAVAMNVCGHRVAVYIRNIPDGGQVPVWIDGEPTPMEDVQPLDNGGEVQRLGSGDYAIIWPSGDQVRLNTITVGGDRFLNIMPIISAAHASDMRGLLGNFNGRSDDDLMSRDGRVIPAQSSYSVATNALDSVLPAAIPVRQVEDAYFDNLYRQFGDSWRVRPEESLFDYAPGQSTATFTDRGFPDQIFTLNQASPMQVESAVETCRQAGVDEELMDGCVFDVAATGESGFTNAAVNAVADVVVRELRDRLIDEVRDVIPGLPF